MHLPSAREMAALDQRAQDEYRIPGILLMEHAAQKAVTAMVDHLGPLEGRAVALLCGGGNNGGDGFAMARLLQLVGARPRVHLVADPDRVRGDAATNLAALGPAGVPVLPQLDLGDAALVVDALLGTGSQGQPHGAVAAAIEAARAHGAPVVAVDLPSGVPADGGAPRGAFLPAALTVTMGLPKPFVACPVAREAAGRVVVAELGFPPALLRDPRHSRRLSVAGELAGGLDPRPAAAHKGDFGRVLVVGGAPGMGGAAMLAARGALRAGAGLVAVLGPPGLRAELGGCLPEAMVHERGADLAEVLAGHAEWADAVVLGPGLGGEPAGAEVLARMLHEFPRPMVVDADGLRLLEAGRTPLGYRVLTPHAGEASRLLSAPVGAALPARELAVAGLASRFGVDVVLKGRFSLVATREVASEGGQTDGELRLHANASGSPALATGGTGDVLAGVLGALLAARYGGPPGARVRLGVWLHGAAGGRAGAGALAGEIADRLPEAREVLARVPGELSPGGYPALSDLDGLSRI